MPGIPSIFREFIIIVIDGANAASLHRDALTILSLISKGLGWVPEKGFFNGYGKPVFGRGFSCNADISPEK